MKNCVNETEMNETKEISIQTNNSINEMKKMLAKVLNNENKEEKSE